MDTKIRYILKRPQAGLKLPHTHPWYLLDHKTASIPTCPERMSTCFVRLCGAKRTRVTFWALSHSLNSLRCICALRSSPRYRSIPRARRDIPIRERGMHGFTPPAQACYQVTGTRSKCFHRLPRTHTIACLRILDMISST